MFQKHGLVLRVESSAAREAKLAKAVPTASRSTSPPFPKGRSAENTGIQPDYCLSVAELPCEPLLDFTTIYVANTITSGGRNTQLLTCKTDLYGPEKLLVAKGFDPLYYCFEDNEWRGFPRDVVGHADMEFMSEVAAFDALDYPLGDRYIIRYHGS